MPNPSREGERGAVLSACGTYRYRLWRRWSDILPTAIFIMLNPSTADAEEDDPTIRKCIGFAQRMSCGGLVVLNLFAYRATDPDACRRATDRRGPENDEHLRSALAMASASNLPVVAAWGNAKWAAPRAKTVRQMAAEKRVPLLCLDRNKNGSPKHPLYIAYPGRLTPLSTLPTGERD